MPSPNDLWHQDISSAPVDPNSATIVSAPQDLNGSYLHPDFSSPNEGGYGIPYIVVDATTTPSVTFSAFLPDDSDNTLFPWPTNVPVEANPGQCWTDSADHHAIVIDKNQCVGYEVYQANLCNGSWTSYANTIWDFNTTEQRPYGLTSVDAAGLSVFEGLVRYDEIVAGAINHAIRFTATHTKNDNANGYFTAPATHAAGNLWGSDNVMGMRIRLKASFDVSQYSTTNQIILNAMKKYGMILADNGTNMFFQGTPDPRWNDNDLNALKGVPATAFEVVKIGAEYDANNAPTGPSPVINSFTASSSTVAPGGSVTLTPDVSGASYEFIDAAGFTRGPVTVSPTATTTYTLTARNAYGTTTASTTVTVSASAPATPSLNFAAIANQVFGGSPFGVSASSNSNGAITYSVVSGPATIAGNTVTITGVGTVTLKATQAATSSYSSATATTSFNVTGATPSISFAAISAKVSGAAPFAVSATSNSQGAITYSVMSGPATISGNTVTVTGAGTVTLMASQAANGNYSSGVATTSFTVTGTAPTISFAAISAKVTGAAPFVVSATSNSNGAITYTVVSGPATISGNTVTVTGAGTVTLMASQAANGNYTAGSATTSFTVSTPALTTTVLTLTPIANQVQGGGAIVVSASSNSPAAISYKVSSGPATISGNQLVTTGTGTVVVQASQAATASYTAAVTTTSFNVVAAPVTPPTPPSAPAPATTHLSVSASLTKTGYVLSAHSNSPAAVVYSVVSGPGVVSGNILRLTGYGSVTVMATQGATSGYTAATATVSVSISAPVLKLY